MTSHAHLPQVPRTAEADAQARARVAPGRVTLVGAGPGDPDLLTIKALKAIQSATLLLVDDLVSDAVVALAGAQARVEYVGKRGGCRSTPQEFIEKRMVSAALAGEHVVRLKGGDPFILGRGGEEVECLHAAGIAVDVVNGISAGMAAMASLRRPLTQRLLAQGVVFVTGHAGTSSQATDWRTLALAAQQARLTLVIYMGIGGVAQIAQQLLTGLPASTPAAVVQNASLPNQHHVLCTLGTLAATIQSEGMRSPGIIVVGDVLGGTAALHAAQAAAAESAQAQS